MKTKNSPEFIFIDENFVRQNISVFLHLTDDWKYCDWKEENFLFDLPKKWNYSFICILNGEIAGFCFASGKINSAYYIHLLFIDNKYRSMEIGKKLLDFVKKFSKSEHLSSLELCCPKDNKDGLKFYERNGFIVVEKEEVEIDYYLTYSI